MFTPPKSDIPSNGSWGTYREELENCLGKDPNNVEINGVHIFAEANLNDGHKKAIFNIVKGTQKTRKRKSANKQLIKSKLVRLAIEIAKQMNVTNVSDIINLIQIVFIEMKDNCMYSSFFIEDDSFSNDKHFFN